MSNRLCHVRYTGNNATDFCGYASRIYGLYHQYPAEQEQKMSY